MDRRQKQNEAEQPGIEIDCSNEDVDWLAFCYVAGELAEDQRSTFEERLAEDQQARDAVVRAVQLTQTLSSVPADDRQVSSHERVIRHWGVRRQDRSTWKRWTWTLVATSACVALVLLWRGLSDWGVEQDPHAAREKSSSPELLAVAWLETLDEASSIAGHGESAGLDDEIAEWEDDPLIDSEGAASDDLENDSWILVALTDMAQNQGVSDWEDH